MAAESIVVVCPDTNVRLWVSRASEAPTGGGKTSILQLAAAWVKTGHPVTIAASAARPEDRDGISVRELEAAAGDYDVAIFVTGSLGHFRAPGVDAIHAARRLFWQNGPGRAELPPGRVDWYVAPAKFLARRAVDEWGHPPEKVVVIPGEAVRRRRAASEAASRDPLAAIYASHPFKGLREAVEVLGHLRAEFPDVRLDVYGSERLWADGAAASAERVLPEWVRRAGETPQSEIERRMTDYGLMLYLTEWVDGFSLSTAEALAAGVLVIATAHGVERRVPEARLERLSRALGRRPTGPARGAEPRARLSARSGGLCRGPSQRDGLRAHLGRAGRRLAQAVAVAPQRRLKADFRGDPAGYNFLLGPERPSKGQI